ncbi:hypothetical protein [Pseudoteredinibacter isoporae]|uniref:hypothetical protein n=1 Tax=Pseudoteredinibacter isoporae TaxID=570281 RepID=UPI003103D057
MSKGLELGGLVALSVALVGGAIKYYSDQSQLMGEIDKLKKGQIAQNMILRESEATVIWLEEKVLKNQMWERVAVDEIPFDAECEYRILLDDPNSKLNGAMFYPSVVERKSLSLSWYRDNYFIVDYNKKAYASVSAGDKNPADVKIFSRCPIK